MKQETSIVARNYRLQEWAFMIQDCNSRPKGVTVKQWCLEHGITCANYYYRLKEVRKAPHQAFISEESMIRRAEIVFNNVYAYLEDKPVNICRL